VKLFYALLADPKSFLFLKMKAIGSSETPQQQEITRGHIAKENNLINNTRQ
jgi:hypothetical protein